MHSVSPPGLEECVGPLSGSRLYPCRVGRTQASSYLKMEDRETRQIPSASLSQSSASLPSPRNPPEKRTSEGAAASAQKSVGSLRPSSLRLTPRSVPQVSDIAGAVIFRSVTILKNWTNLVAGDPSTLEEVQAHLSAANQTSS